MARGKKHSLEQVVNLFRQIEVSVANGKTTSLACKEGGITDQTYYRWRRGRPKGWTNKPEAVHASVPKKATKRTMSLEGKARIAAAQRLGGRNKRRLRPPRPKQHQR